MIKNLCVNKMLFYGKSAIGLGESLNMPATTKDLLLKYPEEVEDYINSNQVEYKLYCDTYYKGRQSNTAAHEFLKKMHKEGSFLEDITTADDLIDRFYGTFPNIYSYLSQCAEQAVREFKIVTPDIFRRIRKFTYTEDQGELNAIKRAAMNMPRMNGHVKLRELLES